MLAAPAAYECDLLLDHVRVVASSVSNTAPLADDDAYATTVGTALVVAAPGVLDGDTDGEADPLTAVLVAGPSHGSLSLNPNGSFSYTPNSGFAGTDSFSYKSNDGSLDSNVATVAITVTAPVNGSFETGAFVAAFPDVPFDHYQLDGLDGDRQSCGLFAGAAERPRDGRRPDGDFQRCQRHLRGHDFTDLRDRFRERPIN